MKGDCLIVLYGHTDLIVVAIQHPAGSVLSWSWDQTLRVWSLENARCEAVLAGPTEIPLINGVGAVALSGSVHLLSDGRFLETNDSGTFSLWERNTLAWVCVVEFTGHTDVVLGAKLLSDGRILTWSRDGTLRIWNPDWETGHPVMEGHTNSIIGVNILKDDTVSSWSLDGTLRVWNPLNRSCIHVLSSPSDWEKATELIIEGCREAMVWQHALDSQIRIHESNTDATKDSLIAASSTGARLYIYKMITDLS
jgi:WD40 repeat protein